MDLSLMAEIDSYDPAKIIEWNLEVKNDVTKKYAKAIMEDVQRYGLVLHIPAE
jgi:hypothetical protein